MGVLADMVRRAFGPEEPAKVASDVDGETTGQGDRGGGGGGGGATPRPITFTEGRARGTYKHRKKKVPCGGCNGSRG